MLSFLLYPVSDVHKVAGTRRRCRHCGRDQVRASAAALAAFEVAIRRRGTPLAGRELVRVHRQTHAAARLAPFETGILEDAVEALFFGLPLYESAARNNHGVDIAGHFVAVHDTRR